MARFNMNDARNYSINYGERLNKLKKAIKMYETDGSLVMYEKGTNELLNLHSLKKRLKEYEEEEYLKERYTIGDDTVYLHKSKRTFSTNSPLTPSDAYSVKTEMGITWKQLNWIFNNNN